MDQCGCGPDEFASIFDRKTARHDRDRYRKHGPDETTRYLLEMIRPLIETATTLLDVGGGVGIIGRESIRLGAGRVTLVDGSPDYLEVARDEAREADVLDRMTFLQGDFVRQADAIEPADIVTLDRVICCYPDVEGLVGSSAAHARRALAVVLPRDRWFVRLVLGLQNLSFRVRRSGYRAFVHSNAVVDAIAARHGLRPTQERSTMIWRVALYQPVEAAGAT